MSKRDPNDPRPLLIPPTKGYLYEIKPGILSLANGGLLQHEIIQTAIQLSGYFILNAITPDFWERGSLNSSTKVQVWQDFTLNPPGTCLVTMDISHALPGVIVYEFLPTPEALEYALEGVAVGLGAALAERYGVSAAVRVAVRGMIRVGSRAAGAYLESALQTRTAMAAARF